MRIFWWKLENASFEMEAKFELTREKSLWDLWVLARILKASPNIALSVAQLCIVIFAWRANKKYFRWRPTVICKTKSVLYHESDVSKMDFLSSGCTMFVKRKSSKFKISFLLFVKRKSSKFFFTVVCKTQKFKVQFFLFVKRKSSKFNILVYTMCQKE